MRRILLWGTAIMAGAVAAVWLVGLFVLPGVYRFSADAVVKKHPERVWAWFVDPALWPTRFSAVQSVEGAPGTMAAVGSHHRITLRVSDGGTLVSDIVVTDAVAGRLYADRHLGDWWNGRPLPLANVTDRLEFDPDGTGKTRIVFTTIVEVTDPWIKWLAWLMLKPVVDRVIADVVGDFRRSVDGGQQDATAPPPRA
jgi:hypothetical protein